MDLEAEVRRFSMEPSVAASRVVAFASGKGGVGVTALTLNTAILLAQRGKRVLVLDGNFGLGNMHMLVGWAPKLDIRDVVAGEKRLADVLLIVPQGVRIIPAATGVAELADLGTEDRAKLLAQLRELGAGYDFVLIDAGSGISPTTLDLVLAADETIVVTTPEPTALANAYAFIKIIVQHEPASPFHLLVNMVRNARQAEQIFGSFQQILVRFLGYQPGNAGFVVNDASVGQSVIHQVPFVLRAPRSRATGCLMSLADKLAPQESGISHQATPSLWRRMTNWRP